MSLCIDMGLGKFSNMVFNQTTHFAMQVKSITGAQFKGHSVTEVRDICALV